MIKTPAELKGRLEQLRDDENALNAMQRDTIRWWNASLAHVRSRVITSGSLVPVACA